MDFTEPAADWTAFDPERDLVPLRARLTALEAAEGVTDVHRRVSARIPGLRTLPPIVHKGDVQGAALSPCGRYLAVGFGIEVPEGAWHSEYEDGGTLRVFELASGGRVAGITEPGALRGGVGWTDFPGAVQWSADSSRIGLAYDTNEVGVWDAFASRSEPIASAGVTDGGNRPPPYALSPDGRLAFIGIGPLDGFAVPGCLVPMEKGEQAWYFGVSGYEPEEGLPRLMGRSLGPRYEQTPGEMELGVEWIQGWDRDGTRVHVVDFRDVYAVDIATGAPLWIHEHGMDYSWYDHEVPASFSADGTRVAWYTEDRLRIADAATGEILGDFEREGAAMLVWGAGRLAALSPDGIRILDGDRETHRLPVTAPIGRSVVAEIVPLTWSPDGKRLAVVTEDGPVEVWNLDAATEPAARFDGPENPDGVYWGDTLAILGRAHLRFCTPEGALVAEIALHDEPGARSVGGRHAWPAHWAVR